MAQTIAPGTFCWIELSTSNQEAAKKFYSEIFGWRMQDDAMPQGGTYTMLYLGDDSVGGLFQQQPGQGPPPNWGSYVSVTDADAMAKKAESLGAKIVAQPFAVMEAGRMAVIADPTGATFALWQGKKHAGASAVNRPGTLCWNELTTNNVDQTGKFYTNLFGWKTEAMKMPTGTYTMFKNGDRPAGGMMAITKEMGPVPPSWMVYFAVADCDDTVKKAMKAGAKNLVPPSETGAGRFAVLQDPQGAVFAVIKMAPRS